MSSSLSKFVRKVRNITGLESSTNLDEKRLPGPEYVPDMDEGTQSYRVGGLCPIDVGSQILEKYLVLYKLRFQRPRHESTSWLARDVDSSEIVQLDVFKADASKNMADGQPAKLFRDFLMSSKGSQAGPFQNVLDEAWIKSPNGDHLCRVLEVGFVDSHTWNNMMSGKEGYTADEVREQALTLALGTLQLHEHGLVHGRICSDNLVFTSAQVRTSSEQDLVKLLGEPFKVSTMEITKSARASEHDGMLPQHMVAELDPVELMDLDHVTRIRAFPPTVSKPGETLPSQTRQASPEARFEKKRSYYSSDDVWAVGCVILELVTGIVPFPDYYSSPNNAIARMEDILGGIPQHLQQRWRISHKSFHRDPSLPRLRKPLREEVRERLYAKDPAESEKGPTKPPDFPFFSEEEYELLVDLLEQIFRYDPEERPTMRDVLKHPWFVRKDQLG
ncbi:MAG: hypothetical protein M1837_007359 [Sclerophora amabilis]|nr:MAG: hypothetical protein M1837_007359 [Sclerophora amabilis]